MLKNIMPIQIRKTIYVDPGWYFVLANSVLRPMLPESVNKSAVVLSLSDVHHAYPQVVLPKSLTGMINTSHIMYLSTDKQVNFGFFLDERAFH